MRLNSFRVAFRPNVLHNYYMNTTKGAKMKNEFISKRGFVHFTHEAMLFDAHNLAFPSERLFERNGVYVQKSFIMQTERETAVVYFVSGTNGDEFGQFQTAEKAKEKARAMSELSEKERAKFDE